MVHHFPFEPRSILGVSAEATADEIRDAFREKSKKHHPDLGGDEWAFRMVLRAYEVLKATAEGGLDASGSTPGATSAPSEPPPWMRPAPASGFFSQGRFPFGTGASWSEPSSAAAGTATSEPEPRSGPAESPPRADAPGIFQTVEVELIWIRFEMTDRPGAGRDADPNVEGATLSVCMVVSWPRRSLVSRTAEYANLGDTLHHVIDAFRELEAAGALAVRSRIEDGQFVGWLSFPDVVAAQAGFLTLRDALKRHDLNVQLQTRDEVVPESWAE